MTDPREFVVEERYLDELIELTDVSGAMAHKGIYHLLSQIRSMGLAHRDVWSIRLFSGDSDADLDPAYAEHLDRLNCGLPSQWGEPHEEER